MCAKNHKAKTLLPIDFAPGNKHVVVGKGKKFCQHSGNLYLRNVVQSKVSMYLNANTKSSKSAIISSVVDTIRSEGGGFVQGDKDTGRWVETSEYLAREKTSQAFRDALRHAYKSSRENKRKTKSAEGIPAILRMNPLIEGQRKRQRTETMTRTTPSSESSFEFPTMNPSAPAQLPNLLLSSAASENNDDGNKSNGDDLYTRMCSILGDSGGGSTDDLDPFEPTPL